MENKNKGQGCENCLDATLFTRLFGEVGIGLEIYRHVDIKYQATGIPIQQSTYTYILQNNRNTDIPTSEIVDRLKKYNPNCSRCSTIHCQLFELLKQTPVIKEKTTTSVCFDCYKSKRFQFCERCNNALKKFMLYSDPSKYMHTTQLKIDNIGKTIEDFYKQTHVTQDEFGKCVTIKQPECEVAPCGAVRFAKDLDIATGSRFSHSETHVCDTQAKPCIKPDGKDVCVSKTPSDTSCKMTYDVDDKKLKDNTFSYHFAKKKQEGKTTQPNAQLSSSMLLTKTGDKTKQKQRKGKKVDGDEDDDEGTIKGGRKETKSGKDKDKDEKDKKEKDKGEKGKGEKDKGEKEKGEKDKGDKTKGGKKGGKGKSDDESDDDNNMEKKSKGDDGQGKKGGKDKGDGKDDKSGKGKDKAEKETDKQKGHGGMDPEERRLLELAMEQRRKEEELRMKEENERRKREHEQKMKERKALETRDADERIASDDDLRARAEERRAKDETRKGRDDEAWKLKKGYGIKPQDILGKSKGDRDRDLKDITGEGPDDDYDEIKQIDENIGKMAMPPCPGLSSASGHHELGKFTKEILTKEMRKNNKQDKDKKTLRPAPEEIIDLKVTKKDKDASDKKSKETYTKHAKQEKGKTQVKMSASSISCP